MYFACHAYLPCPPFVFFHWYKIFCMGERVRHKFFDAVRNVLRPSERNVLRPYD
jgi:hypothetical protein